MRRTSHFRFSICDFRIRIGRNRQSAIGNRKSKQGSALIVALWILLILALLVGSFAFDMNVESTVTSYYRKRMRSQYLARAGVEYAKFILSASSTKDTGLSDADAALNDLRKQLEVGAETTVTRAVGPDRQFTVILKPETAKWDVNKISDEVWRELLEYSGVAPSKVDELIDCFRDYTDADDAHRINGAESDDPFYTERSYKCKNAPLDSVDELLRVKGFTPAIVYGGPSEVEREPPLLGVADVLTVWGNGDKIDAMSASEKALNGIVDLTPEEIGELIKARAASAEGELPKSLQELLSRAGIPEDFSKVLGWGMPAFVDVTSVGECQEIKSTIECTLQVQQGTALPVAWHEGD